MKKRLVPLLISIILLLSLVPGVLLEDGQNRNGQKSVQTEETGSTETGETASTERDSAGTEEKSEPPGKSTEADLPPGNLEVHFIDVGQADSILIKTGMSAMLIDGGNNADGKKILGYLKSQGVSKLDYVIGTHPHEDHIGGLDEVIRSLETGKIIMPKVQSNTRTFESLLEEIRNKKAKVTTARAGLRWKIDDQTTCEVLSPISETYADTNDYSAVLKLTYGSTVFLFTGDAGKAVEREILRSGANIQADVLKVGHHGSRDATSTAFLKAVSPKIAVISVGAGNDYGHPHSETLKKLEGVNILRTDKNGTIVITSDGTKISVEKEKDN